MSTSITNSNGLVVVTQVFPQEEFVKCKDKTQKVPLQIPVSEMTKMFLRGQPQSLGIVQIFIGILFIMVSLTALISPTRSDQAPLFIGVTFVLSGSLSVAAREGKSLGLIRATMALNIISALASLAGIGYLCMLMATISEDNMCGSSSYDPRNYNSPRNQCQRMMREINRLMRGIWGLMLVLTVLEACVSITGSVFSGKAIHRCKMHTTVVMVESAYAPMTGAGSESDADVSPPDGADENTVSAPPAYHP